MIARLAAGSLTCMMEDRGAQPPEAAARQSTTKFSPQKPTIYGYSLDSVSFVSFLSTMR